MREVLQHYITGKSIHLLFFRVEAGVTKKKMKNKDAAAMF